MSPPWNTHCLECGQPTNCGKPFCLQHLDEMPEVARILGDLGEIFDPGWANPTKPCPACDGEGEIFDRACDHCLGRGSLST